MWFTVNCCPSGVSKTGARQWDGLPVRNLRVQLEDADEDDVDEDDAEGPERSQADKPPEVARARPLVDRQGGTGLGAVT